MYRIRRRADGLHSTGGSVQHGNLKWTKKGAVWSSKSALSLHLTMIEKEKGYTFCGAAARVVYEECDVIEIGADGDMPAVPVCDYVREMNARKARKSK